MNVTAMYSLAPTINIRNLAFIYKSNSCHIISFHLLGEWCITCTHALPDIHALVSIIYLLNNSTVVTVYYGSFV